MNETLPRHSYIKSARSHISPQLQINTQTLSHPRMLALGDLTVQITPGNGSPNLEVIGGSN
jgi:hypothetical protein